MQSKATDVTAYIAEAPEDRKERLNALRQLFLAKMPDHEECIEYGMACYKKDGKVEVSFASQKNYIALYGLGAKTIEANKALLKGLSIAKGCIRYTKPHKLDLKVVEKLLTDSLAT